LQERRCKSNNNNNNNNNNNTDSVSVTGWLPEKPFWGEIVEVTGTGFPTDTSDIKIYFTGNSGPSDFEESRGNNIYNSNQNNCQNSIRKV
jgi:hypothetical protein